MTIKEKEIRADYNENTLRIYQAYSDTIADSALQHNTFVSPPFKLTRMTWIKPSYLWMMYRAGWGSKDDFQKRILAIDISREGFEWALAQSCPSSFKPSMFTSKLEWEQRKAQSPVRIQWDPERDLLLNKLDHRSIQIGLSGIAVEHYTSTWITKITDITEEAKAIKKLIDSNQLDRAATLLPEERVYPINDYLQRRIGIF